MTDEQVLQIQLTFSQKTDRYTVDYRTTKDRNVIKIEEIIIAINDRKGKACKVLTVYPRNYEKRSDSESIDQENSRSDDECPETGNDEKDGTMAEKENLKENQKGEKLPFNSIYPYYTGRPIFNINLAKKEQKKEEKDEEDVE